jgi:hypothetical protein
MCPKNKQICAKKSYYETSNILPLLLKKIEGSPPQKVLRIFSSTEVPTESATKML